ncbi:cAMP and cAMP-inhibited cGMP 3',5'-cyclic phosphodiesterase 10A-like [Ischnura elegans]|uniref:cAMP and cAMP-inhibited cGMP 3',5'-cyclic phosphodiesterase 10A-like n=1 Tax=Ischnura elegans TaxID=197161 RepID=UPI001ED878D1|nr:cAMP and cAMP-inhibited cGMP 3',5'-cyclic phosphodiesterase 10A-like [Ischnura elegans]
MARIDFNAPYKQQRDDFRKNLIKNGVIIKNACAASGIHIYMVDYVNQRITLETKLNPETLGDKYQWNIGDPWVASSEVVLTGRAVISDQVIGDDLFPNGIPWRPRAKSAMCLPVISQDSACLGILELYREESDESFTVDDLSIANVVLGWMCAHLTKSSLNEETLQSKNELLRIHNEAFHEIMASLAGEIAGDDLICRVLGKIKRRMHADYIRFCELEPDHEADAPIMCSFYDDGVNIFGERLIAKKTAKYRFTEEFGPLWKAVEEVKSINLTFPCSDPVFPKIGNFYKGNGTKSLLAYPLPPEGSIRGALAVVNKVNGPRFTLNDEIICEIGMKYLGLLCHFISKKSSVEKLASIRSVLP